jgi:tetratricopeptide (TPR) repeat protein
MLKSLALSLSLAAAAVLLAGCATTRTATRPIVTEDAVREARSHHSQGAELLKEGKIPAAIRELRAAAGLNPNDAWIRLALGEAYRLRGLMTEAEHEIREALAIDPKFQEARLTLSGVYVQEQRYPEAIAEAQALIDDPTYAEVWMPLTNKGFSLIRLGQLSEARKSLELAIEFKDEYWRAHLNLGILATLEGRRDEAITQFASVIEHGAGTLGEAEANYRSAEIYVALGDQSRAIRHLLAATERNPDGQWGRASAEILKRLQ